VSDVRALLVGRGIEVGDGIYPERLPQPVSALEEWLRDWLVRIVPSKASRDSRFVRQVNAWEAQVTALPDQDLRTDMRQVAIAMQTAGLSEPLLTQAFALIREASRRTLGKRHHDVQILAGQALLRGQIAEMATGEGKTLAATLGVCTAALAGAAVHVVTVNDYLAERDAEENAPLYAFFGLTVGVVKQDMTIDDRRNEYAKPIVYVSNKELTFDYLKDRIALGAIPLSQLQLRRLRSLKSAASPILRGLQVAIVDEADSVLIDEARTPLIISETLPDDLSQDIYRQAIELAQQLEEGVHFLRSKDKDIWLSPMGEQTVASLAAELGGVWNSALWQKELLSKALSALYVFQRDLHYIVVDNKVQIVDEFTGRVMPDRTWERGLHQMIEAKEQCEISGQRRTLSQITYQRFFGRYLLLCGMTGTAREVEPELKRVYDLSVVRIPTHKASRRVRLANRVFHQPQARWQAVAHRARAIAQQGRSVLVGTRSVEASEQLAQFLDAMNVEHTVLNARQDQTEAQAIAQAGLPGTITVATNMAGRGTDIKLAPEVEQLGGLHVILTEFHESARVDRQLFGRSARQGNPGSVEAMVCLEDELFQRYAPTLTRFGQRFWPDHGKTDCFGRSLLFRCLVFYAQSCAEAKNRRIRLDTLRRDRRWLEALGFVGMEKK
jgi:preprotein translocase subunit SecA